MKTFFISARSREAAEIRQRLAAAQDVVVIGGGFIGLEVAAAARTLSKQVTVIEGQDRLMARVVAPVVSEYFRGQHEAKGRRRAPQCDSARDRR